MIRDYMDKISEVLKRGIKTASLIMIGGKALSFVSTMILARISGPDVYGQFALFLAWANVVSFLATLGMDKVALKFVPSYHETRSWGLLRGFLITAHSVVVIVTLFSVLVMMSLTTNLIEIPVQYQEVLWLGALLILLKSNNTILQSTLRSYGHIFLAQSPRLLFRQVLIIAFTAFFYLTTNIGIFELVTIILLGSLCTSVLLLAFNRAKVWPDLKTKKQFDIYTWKQVAIPFFILAGINLIMNQTDMIMLGFYLPPAEAGVYSVALDISSLLLFGLTAVSSIAVPMMSRYFAKSDGEGVIKIMRMSSITLLLISLLISVLIITFGKQILGLYGAGFVQGFDILLVLLAAFFISAVIGPIGALLNMTGAQKVVTYSVGVAAMLNILLNLQLIPSMGSIGAAIGTAISVVLWNVTLLLYWRFNHQKKIVALCPEQ